MARAPLVLFVCTGNIFRSLIAELTVRAALGPGAPVRVRSAGTVARLQGLRPEVRSRLLSFGLDPDGHRQRRVTGRLLERAALVVAMALTHRDVLRERFGRDAVLFGELAWGTSEGVPDVDDVVPDYRERPAAAADYAAGLVDRLHEAAPRVAAELVRRLTR
jgi:protein-tyrosine phosphatase